MTEPESLPPPVPTVFDIPQQNFHTAQLLRVSRGFSCLFWSLPLLAAVYAFAMSATLPMRWMFGLLLACFLPMFCGLWILRVSGELSLRWGRLLGRVSLLALVSVYLCPFWVWWRLAPMNLYFAVNVAGYAVVMVWLLVELNRLAGEYARWLGNTALRREARAGWVMVLWLSLCTIGTLGWLFQRIGLLEAGLPTVLEQLSELPKEARYLFLLPYAMTAYVMWRAKETGFRRAVQTPS